MSRELEERLRADAAKLGGPLTQAEMSRAVEPQRAIDAACAQRFIEAADALQRYREALEEITREASEDWAVLRARTALQEPTP